MTSGPFQQPVEHVRLVVGLGAGAQGKTSMDAEVRLDLSEYLQGHDIEAVVRAARALGALLDLKRPAEVEALVAELKRRAQKLPSQTLSAALRPLEAPDRAPYRLKVENVIGRSRLCDLSVGSSKVSRRHMRISATKDGGFYVEDLKSANKTWVNGNEVSRHRLEDGDIISIGDVSFQYHVDETA